MKLPSLLVIFAYALSAPQSSAAERPEGLLWNRSGVAATLPLLIKTDAGADYLLTLRQEETETDALGAFIRGGEFFRVLVPPGRYALHFATGPEWQGEADLFGSDTRRFTLDTTLEFRAGLARKHGHIIDLRAEAAGEETQSYTICQTVTIEPGPLLTAKDFTTEGFQERMREPAEPDFELRDRYCE